MYCSKCNYSLANLTEHRCPECGREFDPSDPSTFLASLPPMQGRFHHATLFVCATGVLGYFALMWWKRVPDTLGEVIALALFSVMMNFHYGVLAVLGFVVRREFKASSIVLIGSLAVMLVGACFLLSGIVLNPNPQSAILLAVVPTLQLLAVMFIGVSILFLPAGRRATPLSAK